MPCRIASLPMLESAQNPLSSGPYRGECMVELWGKIGRAAYVVGRMPEPVEWWTFNRATERCLP